MIVKRRNGEVAKVLTVIYALLWLLTAVLCLVAKAKEKSSYVDLSGIFIIFACVAFAGFLTTVLAFIALLRYYNRESGYLVVQRAAVICAFAAGVALIISVFFLLTWWGMIFFWAVSGALLIASVVLLTTSYNSNNRKNKKSENNNEQEIT